MHTLTITVGEASGHLSLFNFPCSLPLSALLSATFPDGLLEKLEDISWLDEQPWREGLVLTAATPTVVEDVDDDLERELAFYNQVR